MSKVWTVRKYGNRKYYLVGECRYVSLSEINDHVAGGGMVNVHSHVTGADITKETMLAVGYFTALRATEGGPDNEGPRAA